MKKSSKAIIAVVFCSFFGMKSIAQNAIYGTPDKYQGYLLLDPLSYPDVEEWTVEIFNKTWTSDTTFTLDFVERTTLADENYLKLDKDYYTKINKIIRVNGINASGVTIVTQDYTRFPNEYIYPTPTNYFLPYVYRRCVANTYATAIIINGNYDVNNELIGGDFVEVWETANGNDLDFSNDYTHTPFYQYMTTAEYNTMCGSIDPGEDNSVDGPLTMAHHALNFACSDPRCDPDGIKIVQFSNPTGTGFQNYNGVAIGEPIVFGVQKAKGSWERASDYQVSPVLAQNANDVEGTYTDYDAFALYANQNIAFDHNDDPHLYNVDPLPPCDGESSVGDTNDSGDANDGPCSDFFNNLDTEPDNVYDLFNDIMQSGCLSEVEWETGDGNDDNGSNGPGTVVWPTTHIKYMQLYKVSFSKDDNKVGAKNNGLLQQIFRDSIYNADGTINFPSFDLDKGLYNLVLVYSDNSTQPILFDLSESTNNSYELSNLLTTTIYPVPFETHFTVKMTAAATLRYHYTIYDERNNTLFSHQYNLKEGEIIEQAINAQSFNKGLIFHKFVFEDGSQTIITTTKN